MARLTFTFKGKKTQKVGYRLFLQTKMANRGLEGHAQNVSDGYTVSVIVWGLKPDLLSFYRFAKDNKPSGVGAVEFSHATIDSVPKEKPIFFKCMKIFS